MEKKNISELLKNFDFVVPEIQREYVWGDNKNKQVLVQFLRDLNEKIELGETNIGFLYSYQSGQEHYLIDGQQRYTTILLLLYYLSIVDSEETYVEYMALQKLDSVRPSFSYRVRTHTDSFLTNLLKSKTTDPQMIEDQTWFKRDYRKDTTIKSMIGALEVFKEWVPKLQNLTYKGVINNVCFWYFDVAQTSQGEELYITMNSRGEKLTDSEQIKPRLLNKMGDVMEKEKYGKKWDDWEEFFYNRSLRGDRSVNSIDAAMNNMIRITLELISKREHDNINPVEDAEVITLADIECYMNAIKHLISLSNGKYKEEVERLYGDAESDGQFYVLKSLLTELLKGQTDEHEYERVYQTIINQVRRNKIKSHIDFLNYLDCYKNSDIGFYSFIIDTQNEYASKVFTGHELDKVKLCYYAHDKKVENSIWKEQESKFWNGNIKELIKWATIDDTFSYPEFIRVTNIFHELFSSNANNGWTTDKVRQALITRRMPHYPDNEKFGYTSNEWKEIISKNSDDFLVFINCFHEKEKEEVLDEMRWNYPETPENLWAEFVQRDYLLKYCNTKHLYWNDKYGWLLVQNSWAKPISVKNMNLYHELLDIYGKNDNWTIEIWPSWESCVYFQNKLTSIYLDIRCIRTNDNSYIYNLLVSQRGKDQINMDELDHFKQSLLAFVSKDQENKWDWNEDSRCYQLDLMYRDALLSVINSLTA